MGRYDSDVRVGAMRLEPLNMVDFIVAFHYARIDNVHSQHIKAHLTTFDFDVDGSERECRSRLLISILY